MGFQIIGQLASGCRRYGDQVLYAYCFFYLSADPFGNDRYIQAFTGRIDGSGRTGRTSAGYNHIIFFDGSFRTVRLRSILFFQFGQQFAKVTTPHVDQFTVCEDRRNPLYFQCLYFRLVDGSVHSLVLNLSVQRGHGVECLHHVGAVGTGQ